MKNIAKIIAITKPLRKLFYLSATLIVVTAALQQVVPLISKFIVDDIVAQIQNSDGNFTRLSLLIVLSFVISVMSSALTSASNRLGDHLSGKTREYLTNKFYDKIFGLPQSYYDTELTGEVLNKLRRGIMTIQNFINTSTNFILPTVLQSIFTLVILAYYSLPTAFFVFLLFPVYLYLTNISTKKWGELETKKNEIEDEISGRMQEVVSTVKVVKSFTNEEQEYTYVNDRLKKFNTIYGNQSGTFHKIDFLRTLSLVIILTIISVIIFSGAFNGTLSIGEMVLIIQMVDLARRPLFAMSFILTQIQNAESGSKAFFEVLETPSTENYRKKFKKELIKKPIVAFNDVSFSYKDSGNVLTDVTFELSYPQKVALVGHSGAGKTTLINLILKLYDPIKGDIEINGKSYKDLTHGYIRNNIALVMQENELFSLTVRENVAYGKDVSEKEIIKALKQANAYDFVMKFPEGLDSKVGERGVRLSGGQKQRIQIARAILKDAPILILDEATSSLDSKSEKEIQDALEKLMKNRLVIIIAHRFSTIQSVDRILVVDDGRIVDSGSPQELASKEGVYSELLKYQIEGNKKLLQKFELMG